MEITEDILLDLGFVKSPRFTVNNAFTFDLGRNRLFTYSCVNTPNEMLHICEHEDGKRAYSDIICIHNYDYDGYMTREKLESLIRNINYEK